MMKTDVSLNPLRRARLAAGLELRDLALRTRISPVMLRYIDAGQFERLPPGIYGRAWVRTVAVTLGLDPERVLHEIGDALRPAADPAESPAASGDGMSPGQGREGHAARRWRRSAAAVLDGVLLSGISSAVWMMTTAASGAHPGALGASGAIALAFVTAVVATVYFALFAGVGGRTLGAAAMACPPDDPDRPLDLAEIGRRALHAALQEGSILIDWLVSAELTWLERRRVQV